MVIMKDDRKIKGSVVRGSVSTSALYCVVSLDKKLYSTSFLSFFVSSFRFVSSSFRFFFVSSFLSFFVSFTSFLRFLVSSFLRLHRCINGYG